MNPDFSPFHVLVAEMAGCVYGSPLMDRCSPLSAMDVEMPHNSWYRALLTEETPWLRDLQENPEALEHMAAALPSEFPIGKRFEAFIRFWLEHGPGFELIASNIQVFREGSTLGEMDFLCRDRHSGEAIHIETACKYYLGYSNSASWEHWAGPNREDRLAEKMARFGWQFGLDQSAEGSMALRSLGIGSCKRLLLLKGMFFHHISSLSAHKSPRCAGSHYQSGWYLYENELEALFPGGEYWILPERHHWLRKFHTGSPEKKEGENTLNGRGSALAQIRRNLQRTGKAIMACRVEETGNLFREESRGFILPGKRLNPGTNKLSY